MQSFFVTVNSASTTLGGEVYRVCADTGGRQCGLMRSTRSVTSTRSDLSRPALFLMASVGNASAHSLLRLHPSASTAFRSGEDSELLLDDDMPPVIAVFSVAGGENA